MGLLAERGGLAELRLLALLRRLGQSVVRWYPVTGSVCGDWTTACIPATPFSRPRRPMPGPGCA